MARLVPAGLRACGRGLGPGVRFGMAALAQAVFAWTGMGCRASLLSSLQSECAPLRAGRDTRQGSLNMLKLERGVQFGLFCIDGISERNQMQIIMSLKYFAVSNQESASSLAAECAHGMLPSLGISLGLTKLTFPLLS